MEIQISVVIPVYNAENTINNCIESALKQDLESFEVILVNDGSNDSTSRILEQYSDNPQVKIFHQVNMGVSAARNLGLSHASGEYVFFLDSDDILDDGMLSKMYQFVKNNKVDLLSCWHKEPATTQYGGNENKSTSFIARTREEIGAHFVDIFPRSACAKLFFRKIIEENNITFSTEMSLGEDMSFVYQYLMVSKSIGVIDGVYYNIQNVNPQSLSKRYVQNIENSLMIQNQLWNQLLEVYPKIEENYYKQHMDFRFYLANLYVNNLFKFDSPYSSKEKLDQIA
ncbi:TPA: glycosyltransferase family 2 protein, partial [Streptococcus pneumoniae]|nr:glycosyltransferase family 2 protein [Streptococcus pneumoniae]HEV1557531.1 glycosyltransferase family 2 protein [Streptococcus pneumoniae]